MVATASPVSGTAGPRNGTSGSDMNGVGVESLSGPDGGETAAGSLELLSGIDDVLAVEGDGLSAGADMMRRERENEHVG